MPVIIRKAENDEQLRQIAELAEKIWHECFPGIISEEQIDYMVEKFQSYAAMTVQVKEGGYRYLMVCDDDDLCGYIAIKPEDGSRLFLSKLYLRSEKRGSGVGRQMLERVFAEAREYGKSSVYLTVNKHNDRAVGVYKKTGFRTVEETCTDIGGGFVMDDFVMEYSL